MHRLMNDPSFAYGRVYQPAEVVESSIVLLQTKLATLPSEELTLEFLDEQYTNLFNLLVESGLCYISAYTRAIMPKDVWLRCQLSQIRRFRED